MLGEGLSGVWFIIRVPFYTVMLQSKADIGTYLVDARGMALYYFAKDIPGKSNATGTVLATWPVFSPDSLVAPSALNADDLATITRDDGMKQAAYKGWPLYYYIGDTASGDTLGQGVGGVWFVANTVTSGPMPAVTITSPKDGASIAGGNLDVTVQVYNFIVVDKQGQANAPGEGHIHYYLDVDAPTAAGQPAIPPGGVWAHVASTSHTFANVAPGKHTISVQLVNNDHTPLVPLVVQKISVTVAPPASTPAPVPAPTTTPAPYQMVMNLAAKNLAFNLSTITVPAGANVIIYFDNEDAGTPHNFSLYGDSSATPPAIFQGQIITGPAIVIYTFKAPTKPGTYFFRCDIHPTIMTGSFIVQ
jgi:predicted lipoprotein with Yx(FWY)xxD motif/plastocyanin